MDKWLVVETRNGIMEWVGEHTSRDEAIAQAEAVNPWPEEAVIVLPIAYIRQNLG